ncbi:MAG: ATP-binding protein [Sinimarinibacterium flocculans]|uniref:ATP-binding protein n=1 Tax=Sinimarinibacterium flocculans TaxID=985250 RepID=UPI003C67A2FD
MSGEQHLPGEQFEDEFYKKLDRFLSPSQPIQSIEHLKGRDTELRRVQEALKTPGRHVFIFGAAGVGKTSLASTAAFLAHPTDTDPPIVSCDPNTSAMEFFELAARKLGNISLRLQRSTGSFGGALGLGGFRLKSEQSDEVVPTRLPRSIDEAVSQIQEIVGSRADDLVLIVDEFDRPNDTAFRTLFGDFIKQLSDRRVPVRLIVCGVATSLEQLLSGHTSAFRYVCDVELDRLSFQARIDIIESAAAAVGFELDRGFVYRICHLSDGFAHFVHLVTRQLFLKMRDAETKVARVQEFNAAVRCAIQEVNVTLRIAYQKATEKYSTKDEYEAVLWGLADSPELKRRSTDIFESANRIRVKLLRDEIARRAFNTRLNSLKKDSHGEIVVGSRAGWYEFRQTMMRGYCRLRAEQNDVVLDADTFNEHGEKAGAFGSRPQF